MYGSVISFYEDYPENKLTESQRKLLKLEKWRAPEERKILAKKCIGKFIQNGFFGMYLISRREGKIGLFMTLFRKVFPKVNNVFLFVGLTTLETFI